MQLKNFYKKFSSLNIFILATLFLLGFALFYFLYNQQRSQAEVFVKVNLIRSKDIPIYDAPYNWIPHWIGEAITSGDKEINPLGGVTVEVIAKEILEGRYHGQFVYLLLKVKAIKDRSGVYLFKNKPLSVGSVVDLKLSKAQVQGSVIYIGVASPQYETKKLVVTLKGKQIEPWIADNIRIGTTLVDNKGLILAEVLDKKVTLAEVRSDTAAGQALVTYDRLKRDLEVKVEILANKIDKTYYFAEFQKVKIDENLYLPFKEVSLSYPIISISEPIK